MFTKKTALIAIVIVIALVISVFAYRINSDDNSSGSMSLPFLPALSVNLLPHLNETSILTYKLTLGEGYYHDYGPFTGNGTVILQLPEGITCLNETRTPLNLTLGKQPYVQEWVVMPIHDGNWTMRVFFNYTGNASKNGHKISSINHPCTGVIRFSIVNDVTTMYNYTFTEPTYPDNGYNQTINENHGSDIVGYGIVALFVVGLIAVVIVWNRRQKAK